MKTAAKPLIEINRGLDETARLSSETVSGARVIRSFNRQEDINEKFSVTAKTLKKNSIKFFFVSLISSPLSYLAVNLVIVAILYFGAIFVDAGNLTQGEVVALINYMLQILNALVIIALLAIVFNRSIASSKRINEVFQSDAQLNPACCRKSETNDEKHNSTEDTKDIVPSLQFKNVSCTYPNHLTPALSDISFILPANQTLGIIGPTGSGKTTLAAVLAGFYDYEGDIIFASCRHPDCQKDTGVDTAPDNRLIAYAAQKIEILSGTIRENVAFGRSMTDDQILKALELAQCDFAQNLDRPILPHGANLSGGQKQRLSLARAFAGVVLNTAKLLILDDATSALDSGTEKAVMNNVKNLDGITKVIISSKAKNVADSDLILALNKGECAGLDKHEELMNNCSVYAEIVKLQTTNN